MLSAQSTIPVGVFRVNQKSQEYKRQFVQVLKVISGLLCVLCVLIFLGRGYSLLLFFTVMLTLIVGMITVFAALIEDPVQQTIIEVDENRILRRGKGLETSEIPLENIGQVIEDENGIYIRKKGLKTTLRFYTSDMNRIAEKDIIFIPNNMEEFKRLKIYLLNLES